MQAFVATKLDQYSKGKISRRHLLESLTVAAATTAVAGGAQAAPAPNRALKAALVNHISYQCPDFHQVADWYSRVFNMEQVSYPSEPSQIGMPFGRRNQKPLGVTADDVPTSYIVVRTRNPNGTAADKGALEKPASRGVIEHVAYTVADFDRDRAAAQLRALGVQNVRNGGLYSLHMTDPFGFDIQLSGVANNALTDGA
jgi:glyoxalase/bleomycin resistance protein/dioxygenase superfamily protein